MKRSGFSLIECMVYCIMVATIMMLWFNGLASFTRLCTAQSCQINSISTAYSALDVFVRDIRKAPHPLFVWPLTMDTAFIFKLDDLFIGWEYADKKLFRYQGDYNNKTKQWIKRSKSLVLDNVQECSFSFNCFNQDIVSIKIMLMVQGKKLKRISYILT